MKRQVNWHSTKHTFRVQIPKEVWNDVNNKQITNIQSLTFPIWVLGVFCSGEPIFWTNCKHFKLLHSESSISLHLHPEVGILKSFWNALQRSPSCVNNPIDQISSNDNLLGGNSLPLSWSNLSKIDRIKRIVGSTSYRNLAAAYIFVNLFNVKTWPTTCCPILLHSKFFSFFVLCKSNCHWNHFLIFLFSMILWYFSHKIKSKVSSK